MLVSFCFFAVESTKSTNQRRGRATPTPAPASTRYRKSGLYLLYQLETTVLFFISLYQIFSAMGNMTQVRPGGGNVCSGCCRDDISMACCCRGPTASQPASQPQRATFTLRGVSQHALCTPVPDRPEHL